MLEIDGLNIVQSGAIVRYIARKHGIDGGSAVEKMKADVVRRFAPICPSIVVIHAV